MKSLAFDDNRIKKNNYEIFSIKNMSELRQGNYEKYL